MKTMVFDIETLSAPDELKDLVEEQYKRYPDRGMSWDDYFRRTALSGNYGRVLCIAYAIDDGEVDLISGTEQEILRKFWDVSKDIERFVGHNILEFDLPFLMKRSIIHNIQPSQDISFARYRQTPIYDTKKEWDSWSSTNATGLDALAKILGYPTSKQGIDGSQVYDFYLAGKLEDIYEYCKRDVVVNRQIYRRLTYAEQPPVLN